MSTWVISFLDIEEAEFELESIRKEDEGKVEKIVGFFQVEDMFDFDNLGFKKTRDNFKVELYLIYIYCFVLCLSIPDAKAYLYCWYFVR